MPNGQPQQLANLNKFEPGNQAPRYSKAVMQALTHCRKLMPEMVDTAVAFVRDESMPPNVRVKCIELIMERGSPKNPNSATAQFAVAAAGGAVIRVEIIDPSNDHEPVTITMNGHGD